jgi:mono/diheme cytochrome c family protein/uncharacterized membrane protein
MSKIWLFAAVAGLSVGVAHAEPAPARDLGSEVREIFAAKCAGCHGPDLPRPKGRFGYVLDLRRLASNPEFVIPGSAEQSELYVLVRRDEMPPADSPRGPLTPAQKEIIRAWIAAGTPEASARDSEAPFVAPAEISVETTTETSWVHRWIRWVGKFHLLLLHFPIALVIAAGVGEVRATWQRDALPSEAVRFCLLLAALAAIPTATLGWLFALSGHGAGSPQLLSAHRWLGTTTAACLVLTAVWAERDARRAGRTMRTRLLLLAGILLTALTAHVGGILAHGEEFFTY